MTEQPMPTAGKKNVTPTARLDFLTLLAKREKKGIETYGTTLQTHNGRDALKDLADELVDSWQYLTQAIMERDEVKTQVPEDNDFWGCSMTQLKKDSDEWKRKYLQELDFRRQDSEASAQMQRDRDHWRSQVTDAIKAAEDEHQMRCQIATERNRVRGDCEKLRTMYETCLGQLKIVERDLAQAYERIEGLARIREDLQKRVHDQRVRTASAECTIEGLQKENTQIYDALKNCGICGIYAEFRDPADAISQMSKHIKEQAEKIESLNSEVEGAWEQDNALSAERSD